MGAFDVTVKIEGTKELNEKIKRMIKSQEPAKVEPVLFNAADTITKAIRARIPEGPTGNLKRAPVTKTLSRRGNTPAPAIAAIDRLIAPHAHLIEFGTKERRTKKGWLRGRVRARPFFRPAVEATYSAALQQALVDLRRMIEEAARR